MSFKRLKCCCCCCFYFSDLAAVNKQCSSTPHGRFPDMCTASCDPGRRGVCPTCRLHGASLHRWWYITPRGLCVRKKWEKNKTKSKSVSPVCLLFLNAPIYTLAGCVLTGNSPPQSVTTLQVNLFLLCNSPDPEYFSPTTIKLFSCKAQLFNPHLSSGDPWSQIVIDIW